MLTAAHCIELRGVRGIVVVAPDGRVVGPPAAACRLHPRALSPPEAFDETECADNCAEFRPTDSGSGDMSYAPYASPLAAKLTGVLSTSHPLRDGARGGDFDSFRNRDPVAVPPLLPGDPFTVSGDTLRWVAEAIEDMGGAYADYYDVDSDGDGIPDVADKCPGIALVGGGRQHADGDDDGVGDDCDAFATCNWQGDYDLDGVPFLEDPCPYVPQAAHPPGDTDGDGVADLCDQCPDDPDPIVDYTGQPDTDDDGIGDGCDNCPTVSNPAQANCNLDAERNAGLPERGDACDDTLCSETRVRAGRVSAYRANVTPVNAPPPYLCVDTLVVDPRGGNLPGQLPPLDRAHTGVRFCVCSEAEDDTSESRVKCQAPAVGGGGVPSGGDCIFGTGWDALALREAYDTDDTPSKTWRDTTTRPLTTWGPPTPAVDVVGPLSRQEVIAPHRGIPLSGPAVFGVAAPTPPAGFTGVFEPLPVGSDLYDESFRRRYSREWLWSDDLTRLGVSATAAELPGVLWSHTPRDEAAAFSDTERAQTNHLWSGAVPMSCLPVLPTPLFVQASAFFRAPERRTDLRVFSTFPQPALGFDAAGAPGLQGADWSVDAATVFPAGAPAWLLPTAHVTTVAEPDARLPETHVVHVGADSTGAITGALRYGAEGALEDVAPSPVGPAPPPRTGFVTALSGKHGWYFLAGGHDGAEDLTDVWRYDLADDTWQEVELPSGTLGTRLLAATYSWHRSQLVLLARGFQGQLVVWGLFGPGAGATRLAELPSDGTPIGYVASVSETGELLVAVNHATGSYQVVRLANARDNYVPFASVTGAGRVLHALPGAEGVSLVVEQGGAPAVVGHAWDAFAVLATVDDVF